MTVAPVCPLSVQPAARRLSIVRNATGQITPPCHRSGWHLSGKVLPNALLCMERRFRFAFASTIAEVVSDKGRPRRGGPRQSWEKSIKYQYSCSCMAGGSTEDRLAFRTSVAVYHLNL